MLTERMRKVELHILHRDIDQVLEYLGIAGYMQIDPTSLRANETEKGGRPRPAEKAAEEGEEQHLQAEQADLSRRLEAIRQFFMGESHGGSSSAVRVAGRAELIEAQHMCAKGELIVNAYQEIEQRIRGLRSTLEELSAFARLEMPFNEIENLTFLTLRFGILPEEKCRLVESKTSGRVVIVPLGDGRVFVAASRKGRFAMDSELKAVGFQESPVPSIEGVPREVVRGLTLDLRESEKKLANVEQERTAFAQENAPELSRLCAAFSVAGQINEVKRGLSTTKTVYRLSGWIPQSMVSTAIHDLEERTDSRIAIRLYSPGELPSVRSGAEKVPVRLKHSGLVHSFERMVFSYGAPLYGTIDPTPLVAFLFILLFAIMFGDVGQGLIGVLAGIVFIKGRRLIGEERWRRWHGFGPIFIAVGIASAISGMLYGSVFSSETLLVPATRAVTAALFGTPRDRIISLMPEGGLDRIFVFFGFTLALGIVINSIGLLINIYNQFRLRRYYQALLTKTGLAGAAFFWYAISIGIRIFLGGSFSSVDLLVLSTPLVLLFWAEAIYRFVAHERPVFPDGVLSFVVQGFVEILESVSYYLSNSLSFLRVAAFALSHTVLSLIVFKIVELLHGSNGAPFFQAIVIIIGNLLIIFLEGLIVSIQVIRLQYYEFFSKFFTETGVEFHPFVLRSDV